MIKNKNLPSLWNLPEKLVLRLGQHAGKQRAIYEESHLLLHLHLVPEKGEKKRQSLFLWRSPEGKWHTTQRGSGLQALKDHIATYAAAEDTLEERYDNAQDAQDYFELLEELTPIYRAAKNLHQTLQTARESIGEELVDCRNLAEEIARNLELLYTDCKNGLNYAMAKRAEEQSKAQQQALTAGHRLNVIMAVFLPITAIASIFGMNLKHGFETSSIWVFLTVLVVGIILGFVMRSWVLKDSDKS